MALTRALLLLAFVHFAGFLVNPLMPDLVIDRALGYVNLLLCCLCSGSVILAPYFLLCFWDGMITSQNRGDYVIHHPLADSSEISDCELGLETQPITSRFCLPVTPNFSQATNWRGERKEKNKIHTVSMTWHDSYRQSKSFNWPVARSTEVFFIFCPLFCGLFDWRRSRRKLARNRLAINFWKNGENT